VTTNKEGGPSVKISTQTTLSPKQPLVFVGLDVHKNSIVLAAKVEYQPGWLAESTFGTENLSKLFKFLKKLENLEYPEKYQPLVFTLGPGCILQYSHTSIIRGSRAYQILS
jgi:hypothetical protein